jgi:AcrR family transcriptional regulator
MTRIPSTERRRLLIDAAIRVIAANGVSAATTRAVVAEAGMSLASFHYAFRSHSEMMRDLVAHVVDAQAEAVIPVIGPDLSTSLRNGFTAYLDYLVADPEHELVMQELHQYALRTPGLEHLAKEQYDRYRDTVTGLLRTAAEQSGAQWSIPVEEVARLVVTVTDGVTLAYLADRDRDAASRTLEFAAASLLSLAWSTVGSQR